MTNFILGLATNLLASFIFLFVVLVLFKPKIKISPHLNKGKYLKETDDCFFIKIINISLFGAYEVHLELLEVDRYPVENGQMNCRFKPLQLVLNKISHIQGYRPSWIRKNAPYSIVIRTKEKLDQILIDDHKSVILKVSLKHGLTNLVKVFTKEYISIEQIRNEKFKFGLKF